MLWKASFVMVLGSVALLVPVFIRPSNTRDVQPHKVDPPAVLRASRAVVTHEPVSPPVNRVVSSPLALRTEHFMGSAPRFMNQLMQDREDMDQTAYTDMERLWRRAQQTNDHDEAIVALGELVRRFPDSHLAGCAATQLGVHHARDLQRPEKERLQSAEEALLVAMTRYGQSRCEHDARVRHHAAWLLASEVYSRSQPDHAEEMLEDLQFLPEREVDATGRPLAHRARELLDEWARSPNHDRDDATRASMER